MRMRIVRFALVGICLLMLTACGATWGVVAGLVYMRHYDTTHLKPCEDHE